MGLKRTVEVKKNSVLTRTDGRQVKRLSLYLPADLAKELKVHCVMEDIDISEFLTRLVERELEGSSSITGEPPKSYISP